jgi:catechol 2,3-dioxygenase-like lactoylglutathione lyase family enzyme
MKHKFLALFALLALTVSTALPARAALAAPNALGVSMGHVHLVVKDVEAEKKFLVLLGGVPVSNGTLQMIQFPGVFINLREGTPSGGSIGSRVNHFGLFVQNMDETLGRLKPLNLNVTQNNPQQAFVLGPEGVRVELHEVKNIPAPVVMDHVHLFVPAPLEAQAWYVKMFGAVPGKRGQFETATVPGAEIAITKDDTTQTTKGRSLDHIGFEVKNLNETVKRLEAAGIKMDRAPALGSNGTTKIAFLFDPWGTYIELTEGLAPKTSSN